VLARIAPFVSPYAYPAVVAGIDFGALAARLDTALRRHGARRQPAPLDVTLRYGGLRAIASFVVESDTIARATVSHLRVSPVLAGVAMVVHPRPALDAPLLVCDIMVPPTAFARAFIDACGPGITRASFGARFREPLAALVDGADGLRRAPVPAWIAPLSGGAGARLRARRGDGEAIARVLVAYVERYLDALATAEPARDPAANAAAATAVRGAVRAHGPASRHLTRAFGADFAARYLDLLWGA